MSNVYTYCECDHCGKVTDATDYRFIVHGGHALGELSKMMDLAWPAGKIAAHFCGYCGCYVELPEDKELTEESCACGSFRYQGYTYAGGPISWEPPKGWKLDEEE